MTERHDEMMVQTQTMPALTEDTVRQILTPIIEPVARALEQLAAAQAVQSDRMEALERAVRLNTPVTAVQVKYLNAAIRARATALLEKRGIADRKAVQKIAAAIRKALLIRQGVAQIREIPRHEYQVSMTQIDGWQDAMLIMEVLREVRMRDAEMDVAGAEPVANLFGAAGREPGIA